MSASLVVVNVGCGNTLSVMNMLRRLGLLATAERNPTSGDVVVLPGVGAWDAVCTRLEATGWRDAIIDHVGAGRPLLGICLGMQLLGGSSEEGRRPGLELVAGRVRRLVEAPPDVRVPRVGWRRTWFDRAERTTAADDVFNETTRFYYSHSYAFEPDPGQESLVWGWSSHGDRSITAAVRHDGIAGCQFHPERSHRFGMGFLSVWAELVGLRSQW